MSEHTEHQKLLLDAIERGDVAAVRSMLGADDLLEYDPWQSSPDVNAPNDMNDTPFTLAVRKKDLEMASLLLKCGAGIRGALLTAVEVNSEPIVRLILNHLKDKKVMLKATVDAFGEDKDYLTPTTPLMYAARHNYPDIVELLIDNGAEIPSLEDVLNRTQKDKYEVNLICVYWHQAITGEAYLIYSSDDPLQGAINAGKLLEKNKRTLLRHRKTECQELTEKLDEFLTKFIATARNGEEIEDLMWKDENGGRKKIINRGVLPKRVNMAFDLEFKNFISSEVCNHFIRDLWFGSWRDMTQISFVLWTLLIAILQPILCIAHILLPFQRIRQVVKTPYVYFVLHCVSKLYFIGFLLYLNISYVFTVANDIQKYCQIKLWFTSAPLQGYYFFYCWLFGMTWKAVKELVIRGPKAYWSDVFNWFQVLQIILYWVAIGLCWASYVSQNHPDRLAAWDSFIRENSNGTMSCVFTEENTIALIFGFGGEVATNATTSDNASPGYKHENHVNEYSISELFEDDFNPLMISEAAFAIATVLSFLSLFRDMVAIAFIGPLRVSLSGMITDIIRFFIIFFFVWISFALGMRQLYQTYDIITAVNCENPIGCEVSAFVSFSRTLQTLFWSMFNPLGPSDLHINSRVKIISLLGEFLYAVYMVVVVVVMLNALIAMMSNTYTRVEENSDVEWKVGRTQLMASYMGKTTTLPPPFNVIPTVYSIIRFVSWPCRRKKSHVKLQRLEEVEMKATLGRHNRNYQTFIKKISERYVQNYFIREDPDLVHKQEAREMKLELAELKEALLNIQTEIMKNQQMIQTLTTKRGDSNSTKRMSWSIMKK